jgi:flavin-dependent dehydrogenase
MGILPQIEQHAFRCPALTLRNSDEVTYRIELSCSAGPARYILILPRFSLDEILRQHAVEASAEFIPQVKVENITHLENGSLQVWVEHGQPFECKLTVIATGANTGLLRKTGLLKRSPPINLAARAYFENVQGLDDTIVLFFDGVERPGYGWVFPTAPGKANIGCGVFFDSATPQTTQLRLLVERHPYLRRILKNARQVGPIKGHPLRTDFSRSLSGEDHILVVGEAAGLVNPITGEGIDYALESAQLAADAILKGWHIGTPTAAIQDNYRTALDRKFHIPFMLGHLFQRLYFRNGVFDKILRRVQYKPYLQRIVVEACFGLANPLSLFTPRTVWEALTL